MGRCGCAADGSAGCTCAIQAGTSTTVTGTGEPSNPWVINARISADAGNEIVFGTDGGLYAGSTFLGMTVFGTAGSFTWLLSTFPKTRFLRVRVVGGGGGSASTGATIAGQSIARGGGGGGAYGESWLDVTTVGASVPVTVGAGGIAGTPAGTPTAGGNGGVSSFGAFVTANGGSGSPATTAPGVPPLQSAGGVGGLPGTAAIGTNGATGGAGVTWAIGMRSAGAGGDSAGGMGTGFPENYALSGGGTGRFYGGGASGSASEGASGGFAGSAGGRGAVIVEHFG